MRRILIAAAVVLCGSVANAAPPSVEPELATWWDTWHTNPSTPYSFTFPVERSMATGRIIPRSYEPYKNQCRAELGAIRDNPMNSMAARLQAHIILGHFNMWPARNGTIIDVP